MIRETWRKIHFNIALNSLCKSALTFIYELEVRAKKRGQIKNKSRQNKVSLPHVFRFFGQE